MNLVDADHRYFPSELVQVFSEETFRSDEEHLDVLFLDRGNHLLFGLVLLLRIQTGSWEKVWQLIELIRHESN